MLQTRVMKVHHRDQINPFGGINFVHEAFDKLGFEKILDDYLPQLAPQCKYYWKDIIYSLFSIYFCGGDAIEDIGTHLKSKIGDNPFCKIPSPDRILDRLKELSIQPINFKVPRGSVEHTLCTNKTLIELNLALLKKLSVISSEELTIDYDNTIISTEKADCKPSYKSGLGYQPGVATLNVDYLIYLENRNGNMSAQAAQKETLQRMIDILSSHGIERVDNFRADAASYQVAVFSQLNNFAKTIFISAPPSQVKYRFSQIEEWKEYKDSKGKTWLVGETIYVPFFRRISASQRDKLKAYRLIVKKQPLENGQIDMITNEACRYHAIVTNSQDKSTFEALDFYHQRGAMEKQFDILKNDFGWNNLPFSKIEQNNVFLILTGMCRNLYQYIITTFSETYQHLIPTMRIKKFIFRFIAIPAKWINRSRQKVLILYGQLAFKT